MTFLPGHKKLGGRKKGTPNKKSQDLRKYVQELEFRTNLADTPLEFLLAGMKDEGLRYNVRMACAQHAAPYVHPKLSAATVETNVHVTLSLEEMVLATVERVRELKAEKAKVIEHVQAIQAQPDSPGPAQTQICNESAALEEAVQASQGQCLQD